MSILLTVSLWGLGSFALYHAIKYCIEFWVQTWYVHKLPGPPTMNMLLGNTDFHKKSTAVIFKDLTEWAKKFYPIYNVWVGHVATAILLSPEDFETVLSNIKHERKGRMYLLLARWLKTGLLTSEGTKWQFRRKILTPAFHFSILQDFIKVFNEETENLVELLKNEVGKPSTDIVSIVSQFTLKSIGETAMGTKFTFNSKKEMEYKDSIYKLRDVYVHRMFRPWLFYDFSYIISPAYFKENKLVKILHNFTTSVIKQRENDFNQSANKNKKKRQAMLDLLLSAKTEGLIDDEGVREEVDTFMFEGHDTTAVAISFMLMLIACHKEVQERIVEEMREVLHDLHKKPTFADFQELKYLERCIKESLRLYPSVFFISRFLGEDIVTTAGYKLKKDSMVVLHIYGLHHNPDIYPDPEKFDPDRFLPENCQNRHPFAYVPFSAGPRNCIGQKFALLELKAVVCGILANFILEPVDTPESIVLGADIVLRAENNIRIKFVQRDD